MTDDQTLNFDSSNHSKNEWDRICDEFENLWNERGEVDLNRFIDEMDSRPSPEVLFELVRIDIDRRSLKNLSIDSSAYTNLLPNRAEAIQNLVSIQTAALTRPQPPPKFKTVGNYELLRLLGEGGMGEVHLARHKMLKAKGALAVKLIRPDKISSKQAKQRFLREIDLLGQLGKHDNIVAAQDAGEADHVLYMVMDYVDGVDCHKIITTCGDQIPVADACEIVRQACLGIQFAHDKEIIHRDIKPGNLMITTDGRVKILDLGLARFVDSEPNEVTLERTVLGTAHYVAPEQIEDATKVTSATDIYSLGCTLFTLLTGKPPFGHGKKTSDINVICKQITDTPHDARHYRKDIPEGLAKVVAKTLEKHPRSRVKSAQHLAEELEPYCQSHSLTKLIPALCQASTRDTDARKMPTRASRILTNHRSCSVTITIGLCLLGIGAFMTYQNINSVWEQIAATGTSHQAAPPDGVNDDGQLDGHKVDDAESTPSPAGQIETAENPPPKGSQFPFTIEYLTRKNPELSLTDKNQVLIVQGDLGKDTFETRYGEALRLKGKFSGPTYCYLFALNPTAEPKWRIQLCFPDTDKPPPAIREFSFPEKAIECFPLTDGVGQAAFVLVYSTRPLPKFDDWKQEILGEDFPWSVTDRAGVWRYNGRELEQVMETSSRGDPVAMESPVLNEVIQHLKSRNVTFRLLAFPVQKGEVLETGE